MGQRSISSHCDVQEHFCFFPGKEWVVTLSQHTTQISLLITADRVATIRKYMTSVGNVTLNKKLVIVTRYLFQKVTALGTELQSNN